VADRERTDFNPAAVIARLNRHGVRYVVIGGLAAVLRGSPSITQDVDVCYDRDHENLERLAGALNEAHPALRGGSPGMRFVIDARALGLGDTFTLTTDDGPVDILATPSGTRGYPDLAANADLMEAFGESFLVAGLEDLIRMKRASGRPKDRIELEILGALREEIERGGSDLA
jgi:hypothetical protein